MTNINVGVRVPPKKSLEKSRLAEPLDSDKDDDLNLPDPSFLERQNQLLSDGSNKSQSLKKRRTRKAKKVKKNEL